MGVPPLLAFGVAYPDTVISLILWWPVGGAKYRIKVHQQFAEHLAYVQQNGLAQVVSLVAKEGKPFTVDARGGPWAPVIHRDSVFAERYAKLDVSPRTVEAIKDRLMERFGAKNTAGLVFFAVKNNLID